MPEAPDLEVIKDYLNQRVQGRSIESARVLRSTVLRPLAGDFATDVPGRTLGRFQRQGKFLLNELSGGRWLVINPMLTGAVQHCQPKARVWKRTSFVLGLDDETELRYLDDRQMGMVYYVDAEQLEGISRLENQGVDVLADVSFAEFKAGLKKFRGEIKGVLTRGTLISGIGNAYSDEILGSVTSDDIAQELLALGYSTVSAGDDGTAGAASANVGVLSQTVYVDDKREVKNLLTDAPVDPGDSGGPVFNSRGEVVGMVRAARLAPPAASG